MVRASTADPASPPAAPVSRIRKRTDPTALEQLLDAWMKDDEAEQRETFEFLRRGLDEDRPTGYKLFS